jgi:hypothetical protein
MRLDRIRLVMPFCAVLLLLSAVQAAAEPVTLTSGGIFYSRQNQAMFDAASLSGVAIRSDFGGDSESWDPDHACFGCTPGTRISLTQAEFFSNDPDLWFGASGAVNVDGVNYWVDTMSFRINGGHIDIPDTSNFGGAFVDAGRFVFHGMITGTSDAGVTQTFRFHGKGTVTVNFGNNDWFSTNYKFADASAAAVPEPGTMLLFGSGAVAALLKRKRRRQHE